jgi:hypothetical protein
MSQSKDDFLFLRSYGRENVLARVQSNPLIEGLEKMGLVVRKKFYFPGEKIEMVFPRCCVVSYDDTDAIFKARELKKLCNCRIICLTSDLYNLKKYIAISEIADLFVAPTTAHQNVLQSAVWKKVVVVPEGVDTIALPNDGIVLPVIKTGRICWFGYPESFEKSFKYIFSKALELSGIEKGRITFITSIGVRLHDEINHIPFNAEDFYKTSQNYEYSLLSHFAFDHHINTIIKSPNKLITSLVRGMLPLVSNTINYKEIMSYYNLEKFTYANGPDLVKLLENLKHTTNSIEIKPIAEDLLSRFSPRSIAKIFLNEI